MDRCNLDDCGGYICEFHALRSIAQDHITQLEDSLLASTSNAVQMGIMFEKLQMAAMPFIEEELKYDDGYGGAPCIMCAQEYDHDEDCEWKILKELLNNLTLSTK